MRSSAANSRLRLAASDHDEGWRDQEQARLEVIKANRIAAHAPGINLDFLQALDPRDPRLLLAQQTLARLQGAMLTPERRDELLQRGVRLGLRPFEANLVMALVQDRARRSSVNAATRSCLVIADAMDSAGRMRTTPQRPVHYAWPQWLAAIAAAATLAGLILRWLLH